KATVVNRSFQRLRCAIDCRSNQAFLLSEKAAQNVINRSLMRRLADANAQAWDLLGPELHDNRFKAVVASRSAPRAQSKAAQRQGKVIEYDQNFLRRDLVKLRDSENRITTPIHETHRLYQLHGAT